MLSLYTGMCSHISSAHTVSLYYLDHVKNAQITTNNQQRNPVLALDRSLFPSVYTRRYSSSSWADRRADSEGHVFVSKMNSVQETVRQRKKMGRCTWDGLAHTLYV